jgi:hypothetical protein
MAILTGAAVAAMANKQEAVERISVAVRTTNHRRIRFLPSAVRRAKTYHTQEHARWAQQDGFQVSENPTLNHPCEE